MKKLIKIVYKKDKELAIKVANVLNYRINADDVIDKFGKVLFGDFKELYKKGVSKAKIQKIKADKKLRITFKDIEDIDDSKKYYYSKDAQFSARVLVDMYYEDEKGPKIVKKMLDIYNKALVKVLKILGKVPYYDRRSLIDSMLSLQNFPSKVSDIFPVPVYISSSPTDKETIGVLIHENGRKEIFEGNDEASDETYDLVNKLTGTEKKIKIWGQHRENTVNEIRRTGYLPKGIYVSPSKEYASGYYELEETRILFSGVIDESDVRKESDVDWKTMKKTKIEKLRLY